MTLDKDEIKYRAELNAVDKRFGVLTVAVPLGILGWPIALSLGGTGAVVGLGVLGVGAVVSAYMGAWDDWQKIDKDDRKTLSALTPKKYKPDLHRAYGVEVSKPAESIPTEALSTPVSTPVTPPILRLRPESHLMLIAPTRAGKTTALWGLIPENADVIYCSLKPDSVPVNWTGYQITITDATTAVNAVLDRVEPLVHAMISGKSSGCFWFVIDEILSIVALCDKASSDRLLKLVTIMATAGAGCGAFVGLLMQSPNASDLGISAAILRNFQAVVLASERSGFEHFTDWAGRFFDLPPAIKTCLGELDSGFWAVSGGVLCKPAASLAKTKTVQAVGAIAPSTTPTTPTTPPAANTPNPREIKASTPTTPPKQHPQHQGINTHNTHSSTPTTPAEQCPKCGAGDIVAHSPTAAGTPRRRCKSCGKVWSESSQTSQTNPVVWGV